MLTLLKIQNLALVNELTWLPQAGFMSITGETGAGKSVIMGAISLILGERADKGMIRSGETQCSMEAIFSLSHPEATNAQLDAVGVTPCEDGELLIRRQISTSANRQFINNTPVTQQVLRQIAAGLVDMHHPEAHRSLSSQQRQLELLDCFCENDAARKNYQAAYSDYQAARHAYEELLQSERASARELDFLRHQIDEIEQAAFTAEEVEGLEARWQRARNAERLCEAAVGMVQNLDGDESSILARLRQLVRQSHELERLDATTSTWMSPLTPAVEELEELSSQLGNYLNDMEGDPAAFEQLEQRVAQLDTLKRKYGADFEAIESHLHQCQEEWNALEKRDERLADLEEQQALAYKQLRAVAAKLSASRAQGVAGLEQNFLEHARQLGFLQSLFQVQLKPLEQPSATGAEEVDFLFGPNPGEPLKPLRMIASSGELARVMLALKSALAKQDDTPLLVFDEIDANVGGEIARAVGMKMRELGQEHQVIAITHFPQVAAVANHHYLITKQVEDGRSVSRLQEVAGEERIQELVRMLGSDGASAHAHARELIDSAQEEAFRLS
ncbi:MAG: DNA repair protein RecN [Akkermansia sp.]